MSNLRWLLALALLTFTVGGLSACNTFEGAKDDVSAGVDAVSGDDDDDD
ncbi:MAG TPA: hypothetical protein VHL31_16700 [Geminicoccus sp.]|jgi:predicted small secreted protein|nr:hypothetical protein [Geminicoccus sp.]HEX2527925.1 hypothetical protein [Geminicoccus sp.]